MCGYKQLLGTQRTLFAFNNRYVPFLLVSVLAKSSKSPK